MTTPPLTFETDRRAIEEALRSFLDRHPPEVLGPIRLAVSGGNDSIALLLATSTLAAGGQLGVPVTVVHVDHRQHDRSAAAADRVASLAAQHGLSFQLVRLDLPRSSSEERLRAARLEAFARLGPGQVWTAHHADDQLETLWFRARRGTGRRGLAGIPERRALAPDRWLGRPLLAVRRTQLTTLLDAARVEPIEDPTNSDLRFARNHIRHVELPRWRASQCDPTQRERRVLELARRIAARLAAREVQARAWLTGSIHRPSPTRLDVRADPASLPAPAWVEVGRLLFQTAQDAGPTRAWLERFAALRDAAPGTRLDAAAGFTVLRAPTGLELRADPGPEHDPILGPSRLPADDTVLAWGDGFEIRRRDPAPRDPPLWIRAARRSDRLPTARGPGHRPGPLLRDRLRAARVPLLDRASWPVLTDADDRPLWTPAPANRDRWSTDPGSGLPAIELRRPSGGVDLPPPAYWSPCGRPNPSDRTQDERPPEAAPSARSANQSAWII